MRNLKQAQNILNDKFTEKFQIYTKLEDLKTSIISHRKKNLILQDIIKEKRKTIEKLQESKKENHEKNRSMRIILPKYEDKVNKLGDYVIEAIEKNDSLRKKSNEQMEALKNLRRSNIEKLVKYIFPIIQRQNFGSSQSIPNSQSNDKIQRETLPEIAEAMLPTYEKPLDSSTKFEYIISNGPSMTSNENFFVEYCKWLAYSKDGNSGTSDASIQAAQNAYRIIAAMELLAQLINSLSFYLDVRLPHKIMYNDFCKVILNEQQFRRKVAKLNLNVIYFAYMQNVPSRNIQSSYNIMENVLHLLDSRNEQLGKTAPVLDASVDSKAVDSIMLSFTDLNDEPSDFDSDDDDDAQKEWENLYVPPVDVQQTISMTPPETSGNAMTTTIMNVVAQSLFWNRWNK